ncbi:hypothetical protein VB1_CDS0070 [Arthrobacter phage Marchesin]|nr:hypothetical protein VB1_CDS0070 [Arthrobacter phage Marchesin]
MRQRWEYQGVEVVCRVAYHVWYCRGVGCYYWTRELYRIEALGKMVTA